MLQKLIDLFRFVVSNNQKTDEMNHQWQQDKNFTPKDGYYKKLVCNRCGATKTLHSMKINGKQFHDSYWERSGQDFGFESSLHQKIECLDWNDNTLD